jgi:hypothetical protein
MRAPVYRNIESKTSFLGVGLEEALFLMTVCLVLLMTMRRSEMKAAGITVLLYIALCLVNAGRAPGFAQHWFAFRMRHWLGGGFFSAAARSRCLASHSRPATSATSPQWRTPVELSLADLVPLWRTLREQEVTALVTPSLDYVGGLELGTIDMGFAGDDHIAHFGEGLRNRVPRRRLQPAVPLPGLRVFRRRHSRPRGDVAGRLSRWPG